MLSFLEDQCSSTNLYLSSGIITTCIQLTGFIVAYILQTETFYDILGGVNFIMLAIWSYYCNYNNNVGLNWRMLSVTIIFIISRLWLLLFLAWRAHDRKGDSRFDNIKNKFGLFLVYWTIQGMWVFLISMPLLFINNSIVTSSSFDNVYEYITLIGFAAGVVIEIVSDIQKTVWVSNGREGVFCSVGIWKYSRHPNYFGEILQWVCCWLYSFGFGSGFSDYVWWICIISPLFTYIILLHMSGTGIWHAEGQNLKRYYDKCPNGEYEKYRNETSVLIPLPFGYKYIPLIVKRTLLFEYKKYEYNPKEVINRDTKSMSPSSSSEMSTGNNNNVNNDTNSSKTMKENFVDEN